MDARSLRVLEYPAILEILAGHAASSLGVERIRACQPSSDPRAVERSLQETSEARLLLDQPGGISLGGVHDIRSSVALARAGAVLEPGDLQTIASTLAAAKRLRSLLTHRSESVPLLAGVGAQMFDFSRVIADIERSISADGEVMDGASETLARIRRDKRRQMRQIQDILQRLVASKRVREMLQDPVVTTRNDRYCLPVRPEYKREFGGIVHDQSASGQTLFMEPQSVVEAGNELRELELKERDEVLRILTALSGSVGSEDRRILATVEALAHLDFVTARARMANAMKAVQPEMVEGAWLEAFGARHPLLLWKAIEQKRAEPFKAPEPEEAVVPVDVRIGRDFATMVITGPNTGGKTVTLKTTALLVLMAQSGMHLPVETARLGVFTGVFADIGDEQSLQQSLSTFSGHIRNIVAILRKSGPGSLVVLDELGAGTDPAEGAALAKAVLLKLSERGARTIATTHYAELKEFAWDREGFQNASVEFDVETLRPTYRLRIGVPGASNALTIAGRLGMPPEVLEVARGNLGTDRLALEDAIARMETTERRAREAAMESERKARELEAQKRRAEQELADAKDRRREQSERAYEQTLEELRAAREEAAALLKQLREQAAAGKEAEEARRRLQEIDESVRAKRPRPKRKPTHRIASGEKPVEGDSVWVPTLGGIGRLVEVRKDEAVVQAGALRMTVPYSTLQKVEGPAPEPRRNEPSQPGIALRAAMDIPTEIHLRHMRADEALAELDRYFDNARLAGLHTLRVVHGKGTGALRTLVHRYLKEQPDVRGFRLGEDGEGGYGVTVVELK
jgi:DNA mismatch repair protein MutS2